MLKTFHTKSASFLSSVDSHLHNRSTNFRANISYQRSPHYLQYILISKQTNHSSRINQAYYILTNVAIFIYLFIHINVEEERRTDKLCDPPIFSSGQVCEGGHELAVRGILAKWKLNFVSKILIKRIVLHQFDLDEQIWYTECCQFNFKFGDSLLMSKTAIWKWIAHNLNKRILVHLKRLTWTYNWLADNHKGWIFGSFKECKSIDLDATLY